ncbi:MAG: mechanosensitive ion channel family protein [Rhizobiaceae bacterium]
MRRFRNTICPTALLAIILLFMVPFLAIPSLAAQFVKHPLMPPATDSPRSTLFGFVNELEEAYRLAGSEDDDTSETALRRAVRSLDLSGLPPRLAESRGIEAALLLKEVLDRIDLPMPETVPGKADHDLSGKPADGTPRVARWTIPKTEITIRLVTEGVREGEYLFSSDTVKRVKDFYSLVRHLPYKSEATPGIYAAYLSTPGNGLELKWSVWLPSWSERVIAEQTVWQWIASILMLAATGLALRLFLRIGSQIDNRSSENPDDQAGYRWSPATTVAVAIALGVVYAAERIIEDIINITGVPLEVMILVLTFVWYALACWLAVLVIRQLIELLLGSRKLALESASGQLIRLFGLLASVFVILAIVVYAGQDVGLPTYSIVTGLGVGGIAIGFGAQTLVRDVFSGIFFLLDDAFRIGEYVSIDGTVGTVDKISVRSLRLRHHLGPLHVIPYGEIRTLTNNSRDWVIVKQKFTVPFETDLNIVHKLFKKIGQEMHEDNPYYAENVIEPFKLQGVYNVDDIGIVVRGKFMAKPGTQFLIRKDIYSRVQQEFEENGIEFARKEVRVKVPGLDEASNLDATQKRSIAAAASQASEAEAGR